jgi:hypothetical protein
MTVCAGILCRQHKHVHTTDTLQDRPRWHAHEPHSSISGEQKRATTQEMSQVAWQGHTDACRRTFASTYGTGAVQCSTCMQHMTTCTSCSSAGPATDSSVVWHVHGPIRSRHFLHLSSQHHGLNSIACSHCCLIPTYTCF